MFSLLRMPRAIMCYYHEYPTIKRRQSGQDRRLIIAIYHSGRKDAWLKCLEISSAELYDKKVLLLLSNLICTVSFNYISFPWSKTTTILRIRKDIPYPGQHRVSAYLNFLLSLVQCNFLMIKNVWPSDSALSRTTLRFTVTQRWPRQRSASLHKVLNCTLLDLALSQTELCMSQRCPGQRSTWLSAVWAVLSLARSIYFSITRFVIQGLFSGPFHQSYC